ncbi:hypothetical protein Tco_1522796 [Tanacetum coccineum]
MKEKGDSCILVGYSTQSKGYRVYNKRTRLIVESININFDKIKELSKASDYDNSGLVPQLQMTSERTDMTFEHNSSSLSIQDHINEPSSSTLVPNVSPLADTNAPSIQELEFLFSPLFKEYFTAGNQSVSKSSSLSDNSTKQNTQPITNIQPTIEPITPTTNFNAEDNNNNRATEAHNDENEFYNIFSTPVYDEADSSSRNVDNSNMHPFYQQGGLDLVNPDIRLTMLNLGLTGNSFRGGEYGIAESTVNEYLTKIKNDSGPGIVKPLFDENIKFEFWGQCNEELKENIFYGKEDEDPHEHISNITKIIDIFHSPGVARDQIAKQNFSLLKVYKVEKFFYVKRNKAISLVMITSKVGIEVQQLSLKDCTCKSVYPDEQSSHSKERILEVDQLTEDNPPVLGKTKTNIFENLADDLQKIVHKPGVEDGLVIPNVNSKKESQLKRMVLIEYFPPVSPAEIHAVEKERKARTILLMAIPKEHLRRFHGMDDAKEIWEAIRTRFGGNANSKKMQESNFKTTDLKRDSFLSNQGAGKKSIIRTFLLTMDMVLSNGEKYSLREETKHALMAIHLKLLREIGELLLRPQQLRLASPKQTVPGKDSKSEIADICPKLDG